MQQRLPARRRYFPNSRNSGWVSFSSLKLYNVNALLTFHNIHINLKSSKNHNQQSVPFSYRWAVNTAFLLENASKLYIPHQSSARIFLTWAVNTAYRPPLYNHTHSENCVRPNIIAYNRFFLKNIPRKTCNSNGRNSSSPRLSKTKFWKKPMEKNSRGQGWFFVSVKNIGRAHPSHPICSLRHRFKKIWDLRFKKKLGPKILKDS